MRRQMLWRATGTWIQWATSNVRLPVALVGFKPVAVFDIAQTEGDELRQIVTRLLGEDNDDA